MPSEQFQVHIITNDASEALVLLREEIGRIINLRKKETIREQLKAFISNLFILERER
jgi:CRP-like cAMP-binding protein